MSTATFLRLYESAHRNQANRYVHHAAHLVALFGIIVLWRRPVLGLLLIAWGFFLSWTGHLVFERNTPAFFEQAEVA